MIVTLELRVLFGPRIGILDGIFDLLAGDFECSRDGCFGPFHVVVLTALDVS